jgi:uncharacterized membrane-anchored protein YjiN (DUF445 family)
MFNNENTNTSNETMGDKMDRVGHKISKNLQGEETMGQKVDKFGKNLKGEETMGQKADKLGKNLKGEETMGQTADRVVHGKDKPMTEKAGEALQDGWEKTKEGAEWVGEKIHDAFVPDHDNSQFRSN